MNPNAKAKTSWVRVGIKATSTAGLRSLRLTSLYPAVKSRKMDPS